MERIEINIAETWLNWSRLTANAYLMSEAMRKFDEAITELAGIHYDDITFEVKNQDNDDDEKWI